jgi:predicted dehydrogenase
VTLKIAIVGCGKIADGHVEEIQKMPQRAQVVAVCDREELMAEQLSVRYGVPRFYGHFQDLLDKERPDVVHITTPPSSHLALSKLAIDAGCHVYVEKPVCPRHAETRELVAYAERAKRILTVGFTYLFDPPALEMRRLIGEGALGEPIHVESFYGYNLAGPFGSALLADGAHWVHQLPGKLLQNNIDHLLNKLLEFIDDDKPRIVASGSVRREVRFGDARDDMVDELRTLVEGERVSAYATFSAHTRPAAHFARVYGTKNTAHVDYLARTVTLEGVADLPSAIGRLVPAFTHAASYVAEGAKNVIRFAKSDFHYFSGLNYLIAAYYDSILDGRPPPISHRDILRVSAWMDEIFSQVPQDRSRHTEREAS